MVRSASAAILLAALTFLPNASIVRAQQRSTEGGVMVDTLTGPGPLRLGSFVVPESEVLRLNHVELDSSDYQIDYRHGSITLREGWALTERDTLIARYRRFPFAFEDVYRRSAEQEPGAETAIASSEPPDRGDPLETQPARLQDPFGNVNLRRSGSITRGIITGNRRDVSVESGLRMQLAGEVAEGVHVQAMLTDENTPIQPEGITRRLNEFDRVSITIENSWGKAELGDFNLAFDGTRFGDFDRKLQGISVSALLPDVPGRIAGSGRVTVAGATSRGIFQSHEIEPIDGVQGPYRLRGREGERFIIVIAGSERVYVDGRLLERGEVNDYTIDYQTGEISFTPGLIITDDRRIQVEFQYTTIEFTRTVVGTRADLGLWQNPDGRSRLRIGTTFLREADSRDFGAELGLSAADSLAVVGAGDALAFRTGAELVAFDPEAPYVQYRRQTIRDDSGGEDSIYVALQSAPDSGEPVYRVRFTQVGDGEGSYARVGQSVNGLQYEFVGAGRGAYEPIRILPRPRQQRLVGFHGAVDLLPHVELFGEWAQSLDDQNRLSALDAADDLDDAYLAGVAVAPTELHVAGLDLGAISGRISRQQTGAHFAAFARTRPIEFGRRWNLTSRRVDPVQGVVGAGAEQVDELVVSYAPTAQSAVAFEGGRIELGDQFHGDRSSVSITSDEAGLPELNYRLEQIRSTDSLILESGTWLRQFASLRQPFLRERLTPSVEFEQERRAQRVLGTDSLARGSLGFIEIRPGVSWRAERLTAGAQVELRSEDEWIDGDIADAARAWTWSSSLALRPHDDFSSDASLGYRVRRYNERFRVEAGRRDTESIILRWNGRHTPLARAVQTDWLYEALTERTPTMQEIYVQTTPDYPEAQYVWEDANGDGLVQIDEFLPEVTPNEGTYARTFVPSDSLTSVVGVQARLRLELDPSRVLDAADGGWRRALSQVSSRTVIEVQDKNRSSDLSAVYLLRPGSILEPGLTLNGRVRFQQELFLFRRNPRYGLDFSYSELHALNELASGRESRRFGTWRAEGRYRFTEMVSGLLTAQTDQNRLESDAFSTRRYDLRSYLLEPEVVVIPARGLELRASSVFSRKHDRFIERSARVVRIPVEVRMMRANRLQVTGRFEWASTRIQGDASGLARYELTDGRGPGTSYLWHVNGQYRLNEYLRASLAYDGRAPEGAPVLHTVRVQMSAIF